MKFHFNHKSNFKGRINRMAVSYAVLNRENFSISKNIQTSLILVSVFYHLNTSAVILQDTFVCIFSF